MFDIPHADRPFPVTIRREYRPPLITDGGPHTAKAWAEHVVRYFLIQIEPRVSPERRAELEACQATAAEALERHFAGTIADARAKLKRLGSMWLEEPLDRADEAYAALASLTEVGRGTALEAYWARPETQWAAPIEIAHHLRSADLVERLWWCDRHPLNNYAQLWRAQHHPEG